MSEIEVKALEWGKTSYGTPEVYTVVGVYRINNAHNGGWSVIFKTDVLRDSDGRTNFATIEAAKAAAQSDFDARIRSAIDRKADELSQDVINLVVAAREFWDVNNDLSDESRALDKALEAFSSRVPYENEPHDATPPASRVIPSGSYLTAEEITQQYGERCPDFDDGCPCCQMWAMHDEIERLRETLKPRSGSHE